MEVSDKGYNTGDIVGVEGDRSGLTLFEDIIVGAEQETPYLGAEFFAVSFEEYSVVFGEDCDGCLFKEYPEDVVAQGDNYYHVMMELGHNVGGGCWKQSE